MLLTEEVFKKLKPYTVIRAARGPFYGQLQVLTEDGYWNEIGDAAENVLTAEEAWSYYDHIDVVSIPRVNVPRLTK